MVIRRWSSSWYFCFSCYVLVVRLLLLLLSCSPSLIKELSEVQRLLLSLFLSTIRIIYVANFFHIWSTLAGYKAARGRKPIRKGEISWMHVFWKYTIITCPFWVSKTLTFKMRQNLSYQNELPLNENGKLFSCLRFCTYLCFKKMSALTWDIENTEPLYTVHVFFEFWRKYLIIISSSSSDAHKIILEDTQRTALRVGAFTVH